MATEDFTGSENTYVENISGGVLARSGGAAGAAQIDASNRCKLTVSTNTLYYYDTSNAAHYSEASREAASNDSFIVCRSSAANSYIGVRVQSSSLRVWKNDGGSFSEIGDSDPSVTAGTGYVDRIESVDSSSISALVDDVEKETATDTFNNSVTQCGFVGRQVKSPYIDDWAGDTLSSDIALVIQNGAHAHSADNIALTQQNTLVVQDGAHAHSADNLSLTQQNALIIQDAVHAHTANNLTLTQQNTLAIQDALHSHAADNVVLSLSTLLVIQDSAHAHSADNLTLTQANALAIADALHAHTADNIDLTQQNVLIISDALHAHISDNVTLTIPSGAVTPRRRTYIIQHDGRTYVVMAENRTMIIH